MYPRCQIFVVDFQKNDGTSNIRQIFVVDFAAQSSLDFHYDNRETAGRPLAIARAQTFFEAGSDSWCKRAILLYDVSGRGHGDYDTQGRDEMANEQTAVAEVATVTGKRALKVESDHGRATTAFGDKLKTPIEYDFDYDQYLDADHVREFNDWPSDEDILKFVNDGRKANARSKANAAAIEAAGIKKPTLEDSPKMRYMRVYSALVANGESEADAQVQTLTMLKMESVPA